MATRRRRSRSTPRSTRTTSACSGTSSIGCASTPDGDGTLLDHSLILYGGCISNGNLHTHSPLPTLLAGGAGGQLTGGRHIRTAADTPMANLLVSILEKVGVETDRIGDSTGRLEL